MCSPYGRQYQIARQSYSRLGQDVILKDSTTKVASSSSKDEEIREGYGTDGPVVINGISGVAQACADSIPKYYAVSPGYSLLKSKW